MRDDLATHDGWVALQLQSVQSVSPKCVDMRKMPSAHTLTPIIAFGSHRMYATWMQSSNRAIIQRPMAAWDWVGLIYWKWIASHCSLPTVTLCLVRHEKQATFDGYISDALPSLRAPALFIAALFLPCVNLSAPHPCPASELTFQRDRDSEQRNRGGLLKPAGRGQPPQPGEQQFCCFI